MTVSIELTKHLYTVDPRTTLLTLAYIIKVTNGTEVYDDLALQLQASFIEEDPAQGLQLFIQSRQLCRTVSTLR